MILRAALALATITDISNKQCFVVYNLKLYPRSYSRVFISSVSKEFRRVVYFAWLQSSTAIGIAIGPLIGGVLASLLSYKQIFLICAILACCIFIVLLMRLERISKSSLLLKEDNNENCYY